MPHHIGRLGLAYPLLMAGLASFTVGGCGGSSPDAGKLLGQTFNGPHSVGSGNVSFTLTVSPAKTGPIMLSFGGPFQTVGQGKLPASSFILSVSAPGHSASVGLVSTGRAGYVTLKGATYRLPASTFQRLEASFAQVAASPAASRSGALSQLGLNPLHWVVKPSIVGTDRMDGVKTTHIHASVNTFALQSDLATLLEKVTASGASGASQVPGGPPDAGGSQISRPTKRPSFDVWTGTHDKTVRNFSLDATLPARGATATAQVALSMRYTNLNRAQTIVAPTPLRPLRELTPKLQSFLASLETGLAAARLGISGAAGTAGSEAPGHSRPTS